MSSELQKFYDAINNIDIRKLSDKELVDYANTVYNEHIDSSTELYHRGLG